MKNSILVNMERCTGCWSCAMACKVGHGLSTKEWWLAIHTIGSGTGIDDPSGVWPNCHMEWQPVYSQKCTLCQDRAKEGEPPYCSYDCPIHALTYGDIEDTQSEIVQRMDELRQKGYRIFQLPRYEGSKSGIIYAKKKCSEAMLPYWRNLG